MYRAFRKCYTSVRVHRRVVLQRVEYGTPQFTDSRIPERERNVKTKTLRLTQRACKILINSSIVFFVKRKKNNDSSIMKKDREKGVNPSSETQ